MSAAMLDEHDRLICYEARHSYVKFQAQYAGALPFDVDDFIQCGRVAVWKLAELPADANYTLATYIVNTVRWRCSDMVRSYTKVRLAVNEPMLWAQPLNKTMTDDEDSSTFLELLADPTAEQAFEDVDNELAKHSVDLSMLSERDQSVVRMRMDGASYKEIAERFGVTSARIHQIVHRLYKRLRAELGLGEQRRGLG